MQVELAHSGPRLSLVLPVGHWLQIDRWLPLEARLGVTLSGVSFAPSFRGATLGEGQSSSLR